MMNRHCVVLAGGLGTRLSEVTKGRIAKAMVDVNGKPFLDYKIESLIRMGFQSIDLLIANHGHQIESHIQKLNARDVDFRFFFDGPTLLGTAGSIAAIRSELPNVFWVTYGDSLVEIDVLAAELVCSDVKRSIMTVYRNCNEIEPSNVEFDATEMNVTKYGKESNSGHFEWIDYGMMRFAVEMFDQIPNNKHSDLNSVIINQINNKNMTAYPVYSPYWDIGNPQRLAETALKIQKDKNWV
jgi:mannose-1-phosphate guanylyltransferase/phosphomannomutase